MRDFARAARLLLQPLPDTTDEFLDPTYPRPLGDENSVDFVIDNHDVSTPKTSPYGDITRWDMLWVGHCGCRFPARDDRNIPIGRAVLRFVSTETS